MLCTLRIRQLAIIEDLTVEFGQGLNLLTGETGAGKSILVDALGLVGGARADSSTVRGGAERAVVEAVFRPPRPEELRAVLEDRGLEPDEDGSLAVRREVAASGGGRVFINSSPSTLTVLRELAERLLELHGQHDQRTLTSPERQLELLDCYGAHLDELEAVRSDHRSVIDARRRLDGLRQRAVERRQRREQLREQVREIDAVAPRVGELEQIERERRLLRHAGEMAQLLDEAVGLLYEGEACSSALAARGARRASRLAKLDPSLEDVARQIEQARLELQDAGGALRDYRDRADFDPARLEQAESRRAALEKLLLRYGADESEVLAFREQAILELQGLDDLDRDIQRAEQELAGAERSYDDSAARLSDARWRAARRLGPAVKNQLRALALRRARFEAALVPARASETLKRGRRGVPLGQDGLERVELRLAANPGEPSRPLSRVASGGELSRVMLALHVVLEGTEDERVMVFDEIDAGVGGAVADAVGARLASLARRQQVLCVTHLPQVAAHADHHYHVHKQLAGGRTVAGIVRLSRDQRVDELARMLGGKTVTGASRRNAAELLAAARGSRRAGRSRGARSRRATETV